MISILASATNPITTSKESPAPDGHNKNGISKPQWLCGSKLDEAMPHHHSINALWDLKWKRECTLNIYPFHFAHLEDMQPIIDELVRKNIVDRYSDSWTDVFMPYLVRYEQQAQRAEGEGDHKTAEDIYLRGATLGMISHFPILNTPLKRKAWAIHKRLHLNGSSFWASSIRNIYLPHTFAARGDGPTIRIFVRRPPLSVSPARTPVLLINSGLDGYRTDTPPAMLHYAVSLGYTTVGFEIPGTGDAPGVANDPISSKRQLDTVLEWIKNQDTLDESRIVLWGTSMGGYNATRAAHTHANKLAMVIAQGGVCDLGFSREWLEKVDAGEYSTCITEALRIKLGYDSVEAMKENARDKFSLVTNGIFDRNCTTMLILNGWDDTIFPIEDSIAPLQYGAPKISRLASSPAHHMGEPQCAQHVRNALREFAAS